MHASRDALQQRPTAIPPPLQVTANVDPELRSKIRSHHTATHLLQSALKKVLGPDTCQQGSQLDAEHLRCGVSVGVEKLVSRYEGVECMASQRLQLAACRQGGLQGLLARVCHFSQDATVISFTLQTVNFYHC